MADPYRNVIRIRATDSPNVAAGLRAREQGLSVPPPAFPGVLTLEEYDLRMATWDKIRICIGIEGEFWEGKDVLLFPPDWLNHAEILAAAMRTKALYRNRTAKGIGCDPAEGGDKTAYAAVDEWGLIELVSKKTPNTAVIKGELLAFARKHNGPPQDVCIDRGGGGKQIADEMRALDGWEEVRTVGFGEAIVLQPKRSRRFYREKVDVKETHYTYVNRRAQLYHDLRLLLDPSSEGGGFALAESETELRRQLAPLPLLYDGEGRIRMLPKNKRSPESKEKTIVELLGDSPDESDALVLAVHAMLYEASTVTAGAL